MNPIIESKIQTISEPGFPAEITLLIKCKVSPEFMQGIQCNPADKEILFDIFSKELEKLKSHS